MSDKFMCVQVKAPCGKKCNSCHYFVLEHLDYFCELFNKYIHGYNRLPECIEKFGE